MINKHLSFAAAYLRLSRDDEDIDGSTKTESREGAIHKWQEQ